jgi:hypothetical protein
MQLNKYFYISKYMFLSFNELNHHNKGCLKNIQLCVFFYTIKIVLDLFDTNFEQVIHKTDRKLTICFSL